MNRERDQQAATEPPEPPGDGDPRLAEDPHHELNNPVGDPDPTEWPDPYDRREDPRYPPEADQLPFGDEVHPQTGSLSTSEPNPKQDPEAEPWAEGPKRDKLDE